MTVHTPLRADDVRRSYARWAGHYDFTFALFGRKYVKKVVNRLNDETHGNQVLDVGCGTGVAQSRLPFRLLPLTAGFRNRQPPTDGRNLPRPARYVHPAGAQKSRIANLEQTLPLLC
ncbi:MAG: hypothetical protein ACPGTH_03135 [Parvibaculales bacterium]